MKRLAFYTQHAVARVFLVVIEGYRLFVSTLFGANFRHLPTCSQYAKESIEAHGVIVGGFYSLIRILKCGPWSAGGIDEVKK